jgi:hypothetical protein
MRDPDWSKELTCSCMEGPSPMADLVAGWLSPKNMLWWFLCPPAFPPIGASNHVPTFVSVTRIPPPLSEAAALSEDAPIDNALTQMLWTYSLMSESFWGYAILMPLRNHLLSPAGLPLEMKTWENIINVATHINNIHEKGQLNMGF